MGDISGMVRRFDQPTYFSESANCNVVKFVHVAAATAGHSGDETAELEELAEATGHPDAIIGGIVPDDPIADTERLLDEQMASSRFRGIRPMGGGFGVPPDDVLRALAERDLIFELMAHPDVLESSAAALADWGELTVVVEHAGWPRDDAPRSSRCGSAASRPSASLGDNVHCKLSGLAMPLHSMEDDALCTVDRALPRVVRRRPVHVREQLPGRRDARHLRPALLGRSTASPRDLGADARDKLFAANAERLYRC